MNALEIRKRRKILGFTQKKLAELVGVSENTIYNYEKGKQIPASKITILRNILYTQLNNTQEENKQNTASPKPKYNNILLKVETIIKELEALKDPDINDLQNLKNAYDLKNDIENAN